MPDTLARMNGSEVMLVAGEASGDLQLGAAVEREAHPMLGQVIARDVVLGTDVRAGADGYLSQPSVLWGPGGHAFSVSHQSVAIFG